MRVLSCSFIFILLFVLIGCQNTPPSKEKKIPIELIEQGEAEIEMIISRALAKAKMENKEADTKSLYEELNKIPRDSVLLRLEVAQRFAKHIDDL